MPTCRGCRAEFQSARGLRLHETRWCGGAEAGLAVCECGARFRSERGYRLHRRRCVRRRRGSGGSPAAGDATDIAGPLSAESAVQRPRVRSDCEAGPRPCPWVSCRHHLAASVSPGGALSLPWGDEPDLDGLLDTCALDVASRGGASLEEVGQRVGLTRERVRQIEVVALERLAIALGVDRAVVVAALG